jgi:hypothetical protein
MCVRDLETSNRGVLIPGRDVALEKEKLLDQWTIKYVTFNHTRRYKEL